MLKSHLERTEEKRLTKRLLTLTFLFLIFAIFSLFMAIPLLAKFSLLLTGTKSITKDQAGSNNIPLFPPSLNPSFEATNTAKISVSGFSESGLDVEILVNGQSQGKTVADKEGKFNFSDVLLEEGENMITAFVKKGEKTSVDSEGVSVLYLKNPPKINIDQPKDGDNIIDSNPLYTVNGSTDPNVKITINERMAIVDSKGKFSYDLKLTSGENQIKVLGIDPAGNLTSTELKINYNP
ncbi:MAG: CUB domain protein [Candidatus Gottesmanbacteria bacterium GW2011_GWC2_39_8]|uniref:CUB domain protein n=1 Tax=Candidatus Gottesmanbacteria bacterium GW2011_GWC2_39_8 TaxID=1618450 RepID=A0A0G0SAC6_9BACT|nr:MAG: CUB domain protein [Candidatus Gottesmanbacteria bacterium GW2011_GWC2_39_8]